MELKQYIGERWQPPQDHGTDSRVITRAYLGQEGEVDDDGQIVEWVQFDGSPALTYNRKELQTLGWKLGWRLLA